MRLERTLSGLSEPREGRRSAGQGPAARLPGGRLPSAGVRARRLFPSWQDGEALPPGGAFSVPALLTFWGM